MKKAFITGITGQDGSFLAESLLNKGYEVHGLIRKASTFNTIRLESIFDKLQLYYGDLSESARLMELLNNIRPDEIYNLACMSHVRVSFDIPEYTGDIGALGTMRLLEAIRKLKLTPRFYQASSSELFGNAPPPQNENTPFYPRSPYAIAKLYSYWAVKNYREAYNLFACNGILFNHESIRRNETFVTRKITKAAVRIKAGLQRELRLGNLDAQRDWGYAPEYVEAMWLILQQDKPDDFVIGTGETHSVGSFVEEAFNYVGLDWQKYVIIDPKYFRPTEVDCLKADITKAHKVLNWTPKTTFKHLVRIMIDKEKEICKI